MNGQLVDEGILKMAEQMAQENTKELQKNIVAVETCGNMSKKLKFCRLILIF